MISIVGFGRPKFGGVAKAAPKSKEVKPTNKKCPTCGK
jgi:hypothetical protein